LKKTQQLSKNQESQGFQASALDIDHSHFTHSRKYASVGRRLDMSQIEILRDLDLDVYLEPRELKKPQQ
jgi:hypothetical protein